MSAPDRFPTFRSAPLTLIFVLVCVTFHEGVWLAGGQEAVDVVFWNGALSADALASGRWWCFVLPVLVHHSWGHVLDNCLSILLIGVSLERWLGTARFARLFALGVVAPSAVSLVFGAGGGGASGLLGALAGAQVVRPLRPRELDPRSSGFAWWAASVTMYSLLLITDEGPGIGLAAHVGGLLAGLWFGALCRGAETQPWTRRQVPRSIVIAAAGSLALILALAPDPRWTLGWHTNLAWWSARRGDTAGVTRQWSEIERLANPASEVDARYLWEAARFHIRRDDVPGARRILAAIAPTIDTPGVYQDLGVACDAGGSRDASRALEAWERSLALDPCQPQVLSMMAELLINTDDRTHFQPVRARALAWCAVSSDDHSNQEHVRILAWSQWLRGNGDSALRWMRFAVSLGGHDTDLCRTELARMERGIRGEDPGPG